MKAMVLDSFGDVENFKWKDWPKPEPGNEEVRIRIEAVSVNPVDYKMRKGLIPIPLPDVLGRDVAGTIDAVGGKVTDFKAGDEVFAVLFGPRSNGAYAEYVVTSQHFVSPKPASVTFAQAAAMGVAGLTAYDAVMGKAKVAAGESVLIAGGAGGVGSYAIPLIRSCGATSIIATTSGGDSAAHLTENLGIHTGRLINYTDKSLEQMAEQVRELTGGGGVAVAFDFVGGDMKKLCFQATGFDGRVVSAVEEPPEFDYNIWRADISPLFAKSGTFHFVALSARARNGSAEDWGVYRDAMAGLTSLIVEGKVPLPKITELGKLSEETIREAHRLLESGHAKGKLVLNV